ncbi:MAG: FecCD family ABC transporter permease [Casimicrobiaceae bacterium]
MMFLNKRLALVAAAVVLLATALLALALGAVSVPLPKVVAALAGSLDASEAMTRTIILNVRLPRVLLALVAGAGLAVAGVLMQALFRNPLAEPAIIGVSAGAALGAVATIVLGATVFAGLTRALGVWTLPVAAFFGALATTLIVFTLAQRDGVLDATTMLLTGIAINALAGAMIGLLIFIATDEQLRSLTFWNLGSLGAANWSALAGAGPLALVAVVTAPFLAGSLNALLLGESEALHLGVPVETVKRFAIALAALTTGAVVAATGIIGFVGLVAPHLARLAVGPDHRLLLPLAAMLGAILLTLADLAARTLVRPAELPLGVLTALVGAPFFLYFLRRAHNSR